MGHTGHAATLCHLHATLGAQHPCHQHPTAQMINSHLPLIYLHCQRCTLSSLCPKDSSETGSRLCTLSELTHTIIHIKSAALAFIATVNSPHPHLSGIAAPLQSLSSRQHPPKSVSARQTLLHKMWKPPPDPEKPNCPYLPGFGVDISAHVAPLPFAGPYPTSSYPWRTTEWLNSVSQTRHVVTHPLLETPPPKKPRTARLIVTRSLAIGNARGAQVLLCSITLCGEDENAAPFEAVAKIYDPLYYSFSSDIGSYPCDVVLRADEDYAQEVAAYECLTRAGQTGSFAPGYFGSVST